MRRKARGRLGYARKEACQKSSDVPKWGHPTIAIEGRQKKQNTLLAEVL